MSAPRAAKICGLRRAVEIDAAARAGARFIGLNFYAPSPRSVTANEARDLAARIPPGIAKVGLVVDPVDAALSALLNAVPLDILQLHGREDPERVAQIRARFGLPVMKAVGISGAEDLPALDSFARVSDMLLVDAKAPRGADLPGGNGVPFDWRLIAGRRWPVPWMLAGGLTPDNVAEALRLTGARIADVSSGVESAPGVKDPDKIADFVAATLSDAPSL